MPTAILPDVLNWRAIWSIFDLSIILSWEKEITSLLKKKNSKFHKKIIRLITYRFLLNELELIEPALYLDQEVGSAQDFAKVLKSCIYDINQGK